MNRFITTLSRRLLATHHHHNKNTIMADVAALRMNYAPEKPLSIESLPTKDPMKLFGIWFEEARECNGIMEANAMTLATAAKSGQPSARVVLLKGYSSDGFVFYSNYNSRKGQELAENNKAALVFFWEPLHRSVRVEGTVEKLPGETSDSYFHSRPHGSQMGACVSNQSQPIPSKQVLLDKFDELKKKYPTEADVIERPDWWGGYLVRPEVIEFWQGQSNRLHNRIVFRQSDHTQAEDESVHPGDEGWSLQLLSP